MDSDNVGKYVGKGLVDAQGIKPQLIDIKGGDMQGFRRSKPGIDGVISELSQVMPLHGDDARIHPSTYQEITTTLTLLTKIAELRPDADKLAEVLRESQVFYEDKLEALLSRVGKNVIDTAKEEEKPGLLAIFEKTLRYRAQYAEKAAATRRKNEEAQGTEPAPAMP